MLAVGLGAFGAHALKQRLAPEMLQAYQTGVEYQLVHTLALIGVALLAMKYEGQALWNWSGYLFIAGMVMFSGSLYLLSTQGWRWLGPVTPLGGLCFMAGWACFMVAAWRNYG
jgi:uncharacterized membrane protein YgdD (TMEM256/DUF423 family)